MRLFGCIKKIRVELGIYLELILEIYTNKDKTKTI